tara:strand:+ start:78 stop:236 length:159 start_codon:yes stop_codon:yes gene_type:complete
MVNCKDGFPSSAVNNDNIEAVLIAFLVQKILDFSGLVGNDDLFQNITKPPLV